MARPTKLDTAVKTLTKEGWVVLTEAEANGLLGLLVALGPTGTDLGPVVSHLLNGDTTSALRAMVALTGGK